MRILARINLNFSLKKINKFHIKPLPLVTLKRVAFERVSSLRIINRKRDAVRLLVPRLSAPKFTLERRDFIAPGTAPADEAKGLLPDGLRLR